MNDSRYDIFKKYKFTSDGTWFVEGTDVFLDFFHSDVLVPYGIRQNENDFKGCVVGDYRFDEETCGTDEFYINGKPSEEYTLEELDEIEKEYKEAISKFTKEELNEYAEKFLAVQLVNLKFKKVDEIRRIDKLISEKYNEKENIKI